MREPDFNEIIKPGAIVIHVMGITNSGKSTLLDNLRTVKYPIGFVEVGKEMRRRYSPDHFKGKGAMNSTEAEVISIYKEQMAAARAAGCKVVFVDGQPRMPSQIPLMQESTKRAYILLCEDEEVIKERIQKRDGDDTAKLQLSLKRFDNDRIQLYDVLTSLALAGEEVRVLSVEEEFSGWSEALAHQIIEDVKKLDTGTRFSSDIIHINETL